MLTQRAGLTTESKRLLNELQGKPRNDGIPEDQPVLMEVDAVDEDGEEGWEDEDDVTHAIRDIMELTYVFPCCRHLY